MAGELGLSKGTTVVKGLHNWYQFHLEQQAKRLTYMPPVKNVVDLNKKVTSDFLIIRIDGRTLLTSSFLYFFK